MGRLDELPEEILLDVLRYLDIPDLATVMQVSTGLHRVASDNALWRQATQRRCPDVWDEHGRVTDPEAASMGYHRYLRMRTLRDPDVFGGMLPSREIGAVVVGSPGCGKTGFAVRFAANRFVPAAPPADSAVRHRVVTVDHELFLLHLWDGLIMSRLFSVERWLHMRSYPFPPSGLIFAFDIGDRTSFSYVKQHVFAVRSEERSRGWPRTPVMILGLKADQPVPGQDRGPRRVRRRSSSSSSGRRSRRSSRGSEMADGNRSAPAQAQTAAVVQEAGEAIDAGPDVEDDDDDDPDLPVNERARRRLARAVPTVERRVSRDEAILFAQDASAPYREVSARDDWNVVPTIQAYVRLVDEFRTSVLRKYPFQPDGIDDARSARSKRRQASLRRLSSGLSSSPDSQCLAS